MDYAGPMRRLLIVLTTLVALLSSIAVAAPLYKWVDDQGNVHYSDKPQPGAKKITLAPATTFTAPKPATVTPAPARDSQTQQAPYSDFEITSPKKDDVIWNLTTVTVTVGVVPAGLHDGDQVIITLDGKVQGPMRSLSATFEGLERGEHTASASLQEADGSVMNAKPVTFYIRHGGKRPTP